MTNTCEAQNKLHAKEALKLADEMYGEKKTQERVDALTVPFLETVFRNIRIAAEAGEIRFRYEEPGLHPQVMETIFRNLRFHGYTVAELRGTNTHRLAGGSDLVGALIIWARD